jgi:Fe-S-cluster containining protein
MRSTARAPIELREELRALYQETDALFAGMSCDASTECCRFGITGREPYPTAIEVEELTRAVAASGRKVGSAVKTSSNASRDSRRALPIAEERRCPMLSAEGRCIVYASRPFGCRTFFCDRAEGQEPRRAQVQELSRKIAALSARFKPEDPGPRPLTRIKF